MFGIQQFSFVLLKSKVDKTGLKSKKVSCRAYVKHIVSLEMKLCIYVDKYVPRFGGGLFEWRLYVVWHCLLDSKLNGLRRYF